MKCHYLLICGVLCSPLYADTADPAAAEADAWPDTGTPDVSDVNEGELEFFSAEPAGGPFHHHQNRLTLTTNSLDSGWVAFEQCHDHLDPVPRTEITFREGRVRKLVITHTSGIARAWVDAYSVQLEDVSADARLCLSGELKLVTRLGDGRRILQSGPYMRRFLDGYYPMRVSLGVIHRNLPWRLELISPAPSPGLNIRRSDGELHVEALFAGRLLLEFELTEKKPP
jgi:hypothetical protein